MEMTKRFIKHLFLIYDGENVADLANNDNRLRFFPKICYKAYRVNLFNSFRYISK